MRYQTLFIVAAMLLAVVTRITPHPQNVSPVAAIALFGAATLPNRRLALVVPVGIMFLSDLAIELMHRYNLMASWGIHRGMWVVYASFLLVGLIGLALRRHRSVPAIVGASLLGSMVFFLVTNFAVWYFQGAGEAAMYPPTFEGLLACYTAGLPFFRNTLAGDLVYCGALFGAYALAGRWSASRAARPAVVEVGQDS